MELCQSSLHKREELGYLNNELAKIQVLIAKKKTEDCKKITKICYDGKVLLSIAVIAVVETINNYLLAFHFTCKALKSEVDCLESQKLNSNRSLQHLTKNVEYYSLSCQKEKRQMNDLHQKKLKQDYCR
jgi:hypothetical protein